MCGWSCVRVLFSCVFMSVIMCVGVRACLCALTVCELVAVGVYVRVYASARPQTQHIHTHTYFSAHTRTHKRHIRKLTHSTVARTRGRTHTNTHPPAPPARLRPTALRLWYAATWGGRTWRTTLLGCRTRRGRSRHWCVSVWVGGWVGGCLCVRACCWVCVYLCARARACAWILPVGVHLYL